MLYIVQTALELGCIYGLVSLALFLSYRILDIADMTTDGCFVLGMAVSVTSAAAGHPFLGILFGIIAGGLAGLVTAFLQTKMGVPSIIAGIITNTGLYTVNLAVMGWKANVALLRDETIFTLFRKTGIGGSWYILIIGGGIMVLCMLLMKWFLSTRLGLSIRATGDNMAMVSASSIDPKKMIMIGLVASNCLTGLSGALAGQMQKTADINAGTGILVIALACLIIGEAVIRGRKSIGRNIFACLVGNIIYRFIYALILKTHVIPIDCLKLVTAVIVALAIAAPTIRNGFTYSLKARKEGKN